MPVANAGSAAIRRVLVAVKGDGTRPSRFSASTRRSSDPVPLLRLAPSGSLASGDTAAFRSEVLRLATGAGTKVASGPRECKGSGVEALTRVLLDFVALAD